MDSDILCGTEHDCGLYIYCGGGKMELGTIAGNGGGLTGCEKLAAI